MFFWTCCTSEQDSSESVSVDVVLVATSPTLLSSQPEGGAKQARALSGIPEEAEQEEEAIDFATTVARGRQCMHLSGRTGAQTKAVYSVDPGSRQLVVKMVGRSGHPETVVCPIRSIEDILTVDDGEASLNPLMLEPLTSREKSGLVVIVYATDSPSAELATVCLIEETALARDALLLHLALS